MKISVIVLSLLIIFSWPIIRMIQAGPEAELPPFFLDNSEASETSIQNRQEQIKKIFEEEIYGKMPNLRGLRGELIEERILDNGYRWQLHRLEIDEVERPINISVFLPDSDRPSPALLFLNKCGTQTIVTDADFPVSDTGWLHPYCEEQKPLRGFRADFWSIEEALMRGYALVTVFENEIAEDDPKRTKSSLLMKWAWGLRHVHLYTSKLTEIDETRFGVMGHSRRGKTALLTAAFHESVSFVVAHQSGTAGAALFRSNRMETIKRLTKRFPHWLKEGFSKYAGKEDELPVDQHLLVSAIAPRPVLFTEGLWDVWANWVQSWRTLQNASEVYNKLGYVGLSEKRYSFYDREQMNLSGNLGQVLEVSGHRMSAQYWPPIIEFLNQKWEQ